MDILGWIFLSILALCAIAMIIIYVTPWVIVELKAFKEKIKVGFADKKKDIEKRSEERQHRDEIKREKDFELANKKLDCKMQKLDKQIKILDEKQQLARDLQKTTKQEKDNLNKNRKMQIEDNHQEVKPLVEGYIDSNKQNPEESLEDYIAE